MKNLVLFGISVPAWIYAPVIYFVWVSGLFIVRRIVFNRIQRFAQRTHTQLDDIFIAALQFPLTLFIYVSGGLVLQQFSPLAKDAELTKYIFVAFKATTIVAVIIFLDKLLKNLIQLYSEKVEILKTSGSITQGVVRAIVIVIGILILMDSFGISITPLIASLGIGSLAVALALQPTLENFFSGVQIVIDKPIQKGQFIKLDSGEEGYVEKIGWRSTWVKMLPNNIVVIPNKVLVNSKVLNYYYPSTDLAVLVQVGVHYDSDLTQVERVTIEVGEKIMKTVTGGVADFKPFIRYHTFNAYSIDFTVILRAKEFVDNYLIKHEFIKALHARYAKEGIIIPYPIRAINETQENPQTNSKIQMTKSK
ncbi:MAG: mechanosensitive ion channel family protein [Candidatus Omnitrophota bacterium]